jgi:hypothetical protein
MLFWQLGQFKRLVLLTGRMDTGDLQCRHLKRIFWARGAGTAEPTRSPSSPSSIGTRNSSDPPASEEG